MAARQGALAAGAARASGERARRRSTPLIGAEPVVPAGDVADAVVPASKKPASRKAASTKPTAKKAASTKPAAPTKPAAKKVARTPSDQSVDSGTGEQAARRPHRPAPKVRSAPSRRASRQAGERRTTSAPAPVAEAPRAPRVRLEPREKARRDAARPHLRIAEPPLDPTVIEAPERTGLPLPDVGDALSAAVGLLRFGAQAAGISPEDIERRVAQVLAYVYQLRAAMRGQAAMPGDLPELAVPAELDPHHSAEPVAQGAPA